MSNRKRIYELQRQLDKIGSQVSSNEKRLIPLECEHKDKKYMFSARGILCGACIEYLEICTSCGKLIRTVSEAEYRNIRKEMLANEIETAKERLAAINDAENIEAVVDNEE